MKKSLSILFIFLLSASAYCKGKEIPSPFIYNITKKILAETHLLVTDDNVQKPIQKVKVKPKTIKNCDKTEIDTEQFWIPSLSIRKDGMWIVAG